MVPFTDLLALLLEVLWFLPVRPLLRRRYVRQGASRQLLDAVRLARSSGYVVPPDVASRRCCA